MWGEIMAKRKMNATIYDVAELANVSLATASRVINGIDKVSEDTKQRVLEAIAELNYKPNTIAKSLASRKTTDVAIIVPEINYSYVAHTVAGLMDSAKKYGYDCLIFTTKGSKKDISETFEKVLSLRVNGVIIFNDHLGESELKELLNFDVPVVCLATSIKDVSCVTFHYKDQVRTIVEECLNIKHKDVYFLSVEGHGMIEERILKAVKEAYMEKNIVFEKFKVKVNKAQKELIINFYQNGLSKAKADLQELEANSVEKNELIASLDELNKKQNLSAKEEKNINQEIERIANEINILNKANQKRKELINIIDEYQKFIDNKCADLIFGIRPDDIIESDQINEKINPSKAIKLTVNVAELLGNMYYLYCDFNGKEIIISTNAERLISANDKVDVVFNLNKVHLFDKVTQKLII